MARIDAVLLAAGQSARFGGPKLLAPVSGQPLLRRQVDELLSSPVGCVLVVVGAFAAEYRACLPQEARVEVVEHSGWAAGLGSSLGAGVRQLAVDVDGAVIVLADQPALRAGLIQEMVGEFDGHPQCVVACRYSDVLGPPALFGQGWFPFLSGLAGEAGARQVLRQAAAQVRTIDWPEGALDLDTREDWERLRVADGRLADCR